MAKIFVKLNSSQGTWEEDGNVYQGNIQGFYVEESQKVKDALTVKMLVRAEAPPEEAKKKATPPVQQPVVPPADDKSVAPK